MLFVTRKQSKKDPSKTYLVLALENDRTVIYLTFDRDVISKVLDLKPSEIANIAVDEIIPII